MNINFQCEVGMFVYVNVISQIPPEFFVGIFANSIAHRLAYE